LVTLCPEKNVNLAHTYTLVGGSGDPARGVNFRPGSRAIRGRKFCPTRVEKLTSREGFRDGFGARTDPRKKVKKVPSQGQGPSRTLPCLGVENIGHTLGRKKR
jgi:hypothetical protein